MFLIRDWQNPDEHNFGLDNGYLEKVMRMKGREGALAEVRVDLRKSFDELQCFLMPHPGEKVAIVRKNYAFKGDMEGMDRYICFCKI